jgi:hypothetical protein
MPVDELKRSRGSKFMRLNRTHRHLLYGFAWLLGFTLFVAVVAPMALPSPAQPGSQGTRLAYSQIGSMLWAIGFAGIFYSWARIDARDHAKPASVAIVFSLLWLFFNVLAHIVYLFVTRGWREGFLSTLRFVCFVLLTLIAWFWAAKLFFAIF